MNIDEEQLQKLVGHFGVKRLVAALPQDKVREALDLVSIHELAQMLGMNYNTLYWHLAEGDMVDDGGCPRSSQSVWD